MKAYGNDIGQVRYDRAWKHGERKYTGEADGDGQLHHLNDKGDRVPNPRSLYRRIR